ncbi:MAG TPA: monovalent cation/H(+) antiporter subunit G [Candidatus Acidoferrales bacterium]|nr:monovalent cation/H(+) antiporter subunit G [Candidatus Acidoferrales bacterium]
MTALIASVLVGLAVALAIVCSIGIGIMKNAFERLHFSAIVVSFGTWLIIVAVWIDDPNWQARLKAVCIGVLLFLMNAVLSHATARAIRIRDKGQIEPHEDESVRMITREHPAGILHKGAQ